MVEYKYDAWGNHEVTGSKKDTIGNLNPFRYRSYFYDTETGLYYLKTRYYDPSIGRFLNMDSVQYADPSATNGLNLYVYCANNPVKYVDPSGRGFLIFLLVGFLLGATIGATANGIKASQEGASGWDLVGAIASGFLVGGGIGAAVGLGAAAIGAGVTAIGSGAAAIAGGGIVSGGALAVAGLGAVASGGALAIGSTLLGLNFLFSKIDYHGTPNSIVGNGNSEGVYDGNGNLIYRRDIDGRPHYIKDYGYAMPHTHGYVWKFFKGAWRIIKHFTLPF